jgi:hypothetical protein
MISKSSDTLKSKYINLQGYFTKLEYDRITLNFLDDYDSEQCNTKTQLFTKSYLLQKEKNIVGNSPISYDKKYFYVKCKNNKIGYIDEVPHPLLDLNQHKVNLEVEVKKYDFYKDKQHMQGWYLNLKKASLLEY